VKAAEPFELPSRRLPCGRHFVTHNSIEPCIPSTPNHGGSLQSQIELEPPEWTAPTHKIVEREDWPEEWECEYSEAFPDIPAPESKCRPGLKVYKGYAAMSRDEFFSWKGCLHARDFLVYLCLYNWAMPHGPGGIPLPTTGTITTSRRELAEELGISLVSLDRRLDTLKCLELIEIESVKGRPRGGRGHSRMAGRLLIKIKKYLTAAEAGRETFRW